MGVVSELRRRNVFRMALLYLGAAWLIMQVVDLLIDRGPLPESIGPITLTVLAIGFPIALIISWFYELTPEGISLDTDEQLAESATGVTGRRVDFLIISLLAAAVLVFAYDKWWMGPPPERSVAVLPFTNMSAEEDSAYFSDGLADTMLHMLAQVPNLRVPARTSSFEFRDFEGDISEIGRRLNVGAVLEGSVQLHGDKVRVIAQLIDVSDGFHIWSRTFDRDFKDIFAIQDDIAREVVAALKISMSHETAKRLDYGGTENTDAYTEYLLAVDSLNPWTSASVDNAMPHLQKAIEIDPNYARAHAILGRLYLNRLSYLSQPSEMGTTQAISAARVVVNRALDIAPDLPEALAVLGVVEMVDGNHDNGQHMLRKALEADPNNLLALRYYASHLAGVGRPAEALEVFRRIIKLNPLEEAGYSGVVSILRDQGKLAEALETALRFREVMPDSPKAIYLEGDCRAFTGEYAAVIKTDEELFALDPDDTRLWRVFPAPYLMLDMVEEARYWFDRLAEVNPEDSYSRLGQILLNYYLQKNEEENFRLVQEILTEDPDLGYRSLEIALVLLTEYGAKLGRHDIVLEVLDNLYPNLFDDPPNDFHASDLGLYFAGLALLQRGDIDRGTFLMKTYLEDQDRGDEAYAVRWRSVTGRLALGEAEAAMAKLREKRRTMYLYTLVFDNVMFKHSKLYDPIRHEPEFIALLDEYRKNAAEQRRLVQEMGIH
jgi:TolB-like protein/Tfp pilus assembly protein PilF